MKPLIIYATGRHRNGDTINISVTTFVKTVIISVEEPKRNGKM